MTQVFRPVRVKESFAEIWQEVIKGVGILINLKFIVFNPTVDSGVTKTIQNTAHFIMSICDFMFAKEDESGITEVIEESRSGVTNFKNGCVFASREGSVLGDTLSCTYPFIYPIYYSYFTFISLCLHIYLLLFGYHLTLSCSQ